jgi:hypothetical protein
MRPVQLLGLNKIQGYFYTAFIDSVVSWLYNKWQWLIYVDILLVPILKKGFQFCVNKFTFIDKYEIYFIYLNITVTHGLEIVHEHECVFLWTFC